jgi:hypothetical protein
MEDAAHFRKMHTQRALQKARQDLHGKRQTLPGKSCLPEEIAISVWCCVCGVCILAWEVLCKIWLKSLISHLANALCEVGTPPAMYFAKRGKSREKIKPQKTP